MDAYLFQGDIYCPDCILPYLTGTYSGNEHKAPQGPYPDGGGYADGAQICYHCHTLLHNPLTREGYRSVLTDYLESLINVANGGEDNPIALQAWEHYCSATTPQALAEALRYRATELA